VIPTVFPTAASLTNAVLPFIPQHRTSFSKAANHRAGCRSLPVTEWPKSTPLRTVEPRRHTLSQGRKADGRRARNAPYSTALQDAELVSGFARRRPFGSLSRSTLRLRPPGFASGSDRTRASRHGSVAAGMPSRSSMAGRKTFAPAYGHSPAAASRPFCRGSGSGFGEFIELVQLALERSPIR
jgi:hypothetical protein